MTKTIALAQENIQYGGELGKITAARLVDLDLIATLATAFVADTSNEDTLTALKMELSNVGDTI